MLVGLLPPSGGSAHVGGHDIRSDMGPVYALMGVCPQHDLLWDSLTGAEHLRFYGRLKGMTGKVLLSRHLSYGRAICTGTMGRALFILCTAPFMTPHGFFAPLPPHPSHPAPLQALSWRRPWKRRCAASICGMGVLVTSLLERTVVG